MTLLNTDTNMLYKGDAEVDAIYKGSDLVWQNSPLLQQVYTIGEKFTNTYGAKYSLGAQYAYMHVHGNPFDPPPNIETDIYALNMGATTAPGGSRSPSTFLGNTVTFAGIFVVSASTRAAATQFWFRMAVLGKKTADMSKIVRILPQGGEWTNVDTVTEMLPTNTSSGDTVTVADFLLSTDIPRWDGSGSSTVIVEYTP